MSTCELLCGAYAVRPACYGHPVPRCDEDAAASVEAAKDGLTLFEADAGMDAHDVEVERRRVDEEMEER